MSTNRMTRTARLLGAAGVAGLAVLLGAPAAQAAELTELAQVTESGPTVTFSGGGIGVLSCPANPNVSKVALTEGNWVNVVNNTGYDADVTVASKTFQMESGSGRAFQLAPGTYQLQMAPKCLLKMSKPGSVAVEVATRRPAPAPSPSGTGRQPGTSTGGGSAPRGGSAGQDRQEANERPDRPAQSSEATPGALGASPAGVPPTGAATLDGLDELPPPPTDELAVPGEPGSGDVVAVTEFEPTGDLIGPARASRLLALIATVCVLGVTVAAFRAIVSQRTKRVIAA